MSGRAHSPGAEDEFERGADASPDYDVFLAYNSQDKGAVAAVKTIKLALEDDGLSVWFASEVIPGNLVTQEMRKGIDSSRCCALLHGEGGFGLWEGQFEQELGIHATVKRPGFRLFVVLLPGSADPDTLPKELTIRGSCDLREDISDEGLTEDGLLRVLGAARGKKVSELRKAARTDDAPGRNRALLVNVGTYSVDPGLKKLHGPHSDVALLERALARAGMPPGEEWIVTLCPEPDLKTLEDALKTFFAVESSPGDTVLFYYSGHGVVDDDSYLCATDTNLEELSWTAISAKQVVERVKRCPATAKVVILDCCHAARLERSAYEKLPDDSAVVLGSRGPAADAAVGSEPSPFTRSIVEVFGDAEAYGDGGLTVGDLLDALAKRGEKPWTNPTCAREILLARRAESTEPPPMETRPVISVEVCSRAEPDDRLPLLRQLAATLDGMLAMAAEERQVPTPVVRQTIELLAHELHRLALAPEQAGELDRILAAPAVDAPQTCAVRFADPDVGRLADLPWEYLALHRRAEQQDDLLRRPRIAIERVFAGTRTKRGGAAIQRVLLFSSLGMVESEDAEALTTATEQQLKEKFHVAPEVTRQAQWSTFSGAPKSADVVILQTPVRLKEGEVQVLFSKPGSDEMKEVPADSISTILNERPELTWLFIETVAANSRHQPALAVRRLAEHLATALSRPVVAICHSRAYLSCLRENPDAATFLPHLLGKLDAKWPLDHAAHAARDSVVSSLALNDPAIIGFPIVMRPVEKEPPESEPERPVARR